MIDKHPVSLKAFVPAMRQFMSEPPLLIECRGLPSLMNRLTDPALEPAGLTVQNADSFQVKRVTSGFLVIENCRVSTSPAVLGESVFERL